MKKVVTIGGGTGLSTLLNGVKYIDGITISAIVTVTDDGGSTGLLKKHFNIPAVGDLRRVIGALSRHRTDLEEQMEYRFKGTNTDLDGHTLGNLILSANIMNSKDFATGIKKTSNMLNIEGEVLPISLSNTDLVTQYTDGTTVFGETKLSNPNKVVDQVWVEGGEATLDVIKAIENADYIIFGMGSLYTSLISNLVFFGVKEALMKTKAKIIYIANAFTEYGETDNYTLSDHINAIEKHTYKGSVDKVIFPKGSLSNKVIDKYTNDNQFLVKNDLINDERVIISRLLYVNSKGLVRHNKTLLKNSLEKVIK